MIAQGYTVISPILKFIKISTYIRSNLSWCYCLFHLIFLIQKFSFSNLILIIFGINNFHYLFLLGKTETRRLHVKFIWLYCSHCAYCRCFQKVRLQWHLVVALGHCNSAYQLSLWPCQVGSFVLFICNHPALTQQQAQTPHSAANERTNPKPPTLPLLTWPLRLFPSLCVRGMLNRAEYTRWQTRGQTNHLKNTKGSAN